MKKFSISRFLKISYWYIAGNRKLWLRFYVSYVIIMLLLAVMDTLEIYLYNSNDYSFSDLRSTFVLFTLMYTFLAGPAMFAIRLNTKQNRIDLFMTPASNAEKFISIAAMSYIIIGLLGVLAIMTADVLNYGLQMLLGFANPVFVMPEVVSKFGEYCDESGATGTLHYLAVAQTLFIWACGSSILLYMAIALKKNTRLTATFLLAIVILAFHYDEFSQIAGLSGESGLVASNIIIAIVAMFALTAFFVWMSYRSFSHLQIIDNKLINL